MISLREMDRSQKPKLKGSTESALFELCASSSGQAADFLRSESLRYLFKFLVLVSIIGSLDEPISVAEVTIDAIESRLLVFFATDN